MIILHAVWYEDSLHIWAEQPIQAGKLSRKRTRGTTTKTAPMSPYDPGAEALAAASLHDHWIEALRGESGEMRGNKEELRLLFEQVRDWRRPL